MPNFYQVASWQLCIFICLLLQSTLSPAQYRFSVEHYTADKGLPQNSIKSIAADADGFIWLATENGLTRFDGRKFEVFENSTINVHTKRVVSILPGQRNRIRRNRLNVAYAMFSSDEMANISGGHASPIGNDLQVHKSNMGKLRAEKKDIYYVGGLPERWQRAMLPEIPSLITDNYAEGRFYLCDASTVTYYKQWRKRYEVKNEAAERLNYFTLGGRLYYFDGRREFVQIYDNKRFSFKIKGDILQSKEFVSRELPIKIYWNDNTDQAFLYLNGQLFELVQERDGSLSTHLLTSGFDLASENIDVIFYLPENKKLFLGSSTNGLFVLSIAQFETIKVSGADRPNIFYGQIPYDDNSVLTPNGIIAGKDARTGAVIDRRLSELERLQTDDKRFIFRDRQGNIWAKRGNTLVRFDRENRVIGSWTFRNGVKAVCQRGDSEFWIGVYEVGIFKIDFKNPSTQPEFVGGELAKHITCMRLRNADELWVGTLKGLYSFNNRNGQAQLVSGTSGMNIRSVQADTGGRFWVTVVDKGLMLLHNDHQLTPFPLDDQGFLASAHYAFDDGNGFLWVPTNRGLFQMKVSDLLGYAARHRNNAIVSDSNALSRAQERLFYGYHSMNEGFATNEFNGGCSSCGLMLGSGYISLPSIDGMVWFKPKQICPPVSNGGIILDGVYLNGAKIHVSGDTVSLPLKPENIRFDFATAHFGNNYNLHVSYALAKEAENVPVSAWQPLDNEGKISVRYSSLPSGKYLLLIRKEAGFGVENVVVKKIHIVVPELWYESSWAILFFVLSFTLLLIFCVRRYNANRLRTIQREKDELERIVSMRTNTLQTTLTDLDEQVHIMSRMIASISHDVQTPLNYITVASEDIQDLIKENHLEDVSKVATMIASVSGRTGRLLNDLLNYVKMQVYGKRVRFETINLSDLIAEKLELFESVIRRQENIIVVNVPADLTVRSDDQLLSIIIHNLIDNAVKYTRRGKIVFNVYTNADEVELVIANSGQPLSREKMDLINNASADNGLPATQQHEHGSSLGLIIVKEVSQLIGVKVFVTQTETVNFHIQFGNLR